MYRGTPPQELLQYYLSNTPFFSVSILFIFVFACHIIFRVSGFYLSKRFSSNTRDMLDITKAILFFMRHDFRGRVYFQSKVHFHPVRFFLFLHILLYTH